MPKKGKKNMDQNSNAQEQELLLQISNTKSIVKKTSNSMVKWVMKMMMWVFFILWIAIIFIYPLESSVAWFEFWVHATSASFLGITGTTFVLFSGPLIAISLLSVLYLAIDSHPDEFQERNTKTKKARPRYKLGTFPVVVGGPLGVVSAAELIGIAAFAVYVIWVAAVYIVQKLSVLFANPDYTTFDRWSWMFRMSGRGCGLTGIFCLSFMFIPVSRTSSLLRLVNISSQHAIRYHIWVAHLCMCLFTSHGFLYLIGWFMSGEIPSELISWTPTDGANLAGIINIFFGWTIWITSLPFVRQNHFELFYYTHHLYIIFIIFLAMHVGNFFFCIVAGSIFLFIIDRFLRFCQSRHTVDVISTTSFRCGVVQLVMTTPSSLNYNALSTIFLQIKELSLLQWHPFSVSNSPLDGKNCLSVLIKACGNWTSQFEDHALNFKVAKELRLHDSTRLTAAVEGPYGYELSCHLTYEHLILVAGGIGISPFIAVLSDIIHRINLGKPCLPRNIYLVWAMKTSDELSLLSTIGIHSVRSTPSDELHLEILIYVTQQSQPPSENVVVDKPVMSCIRGTTIRNSISVLTAGNKTWFAAYAISSSVGLIAFMSIVNLLYVRPYEIVNWWYQGLLLVACMVASALLCGGAVIRLWHTSEKEKNFNDIEEIIDEESSSNECTDHHKIDSLPKYFGSSTTIQYSSRPNFKEIFGSISKVSGNVDVGVMVCGPKSLEKSVAKECRSLNISRQSGDPIFHFNTHTFSF